MVVPESVLKVSVKICIFIEPVVTPVAGQSKQAQRARRDYEVHMFKPMQLAHRQRVPAMGEVLQIEHVTPACVMSLAPLSENDGKTAAGNNLRQSHRMAARKKCLLMGALIRMRACVTGSWVFLRWAKDAVSNSSNVGRSVLCLTWQRRNTCSNRGCHDPYTSHATQRSKLGQ